MVRDLWEKKYICVDDIGGYEITSNVGDCKWVWKYEVKSICDDNSPLITRDSGGPIPEFRKCGDLKIEVCLDSLIQQLCTNLITASMMPVFKMNLGGISYHFNLVSRPPEQPPVTVSQCDKVAGGIIGKVGPINSPVYIVYPSEQCKSPASRSNMKGMCVVKISHTETCNLMDSVMTWIFNNNNPKQVYIQEVGGEHVFYSQDHHAPIRFKEYVFVEKETKPPVNQSGFRLYRNKEGELIFTIDGIMRFKYIDGDFTLYGLNNNVVYNKSDTGEVDVLLMLNFLCYGYNGCR
jgi:hypothetical protein